MKRISFILLLALSLTACNYVSTVTPATYQGGTPTFIAATATPTADIPPTYEGCAYMWASQDLPALTQKVNDSLQALDKTVSASAYAYGENCVYADGHSTFGAMETDYRVNVEVRDIKDEKALGDMIAKVMGVIIKIPPADTAGPNPGRVEFSFRHGDDQTAVNVQINQYIHDAASLKGAELYKFFHQNP